ncbi:excisionase family DNA-binding protein [Acidocella sp. KAb 2-4]|nr:helix-turn-helix domain-containing protein [Acidocella sp. KAb 2-4]
MATIRRSIRTGALPVHRFGRTVRISQADFDAYVSRSRR